MLIGRDSERGALDGLLASARLGRGGAVVVTGEPGIGKTSLVDDLVSRAAGAQVVRVAGSEAERDVPFGVLGLVLAPSRDDLAAIPAPQARALGVALALEDGDVVERYAVGAATLSLLARRADTRPVLVVVDDGHHVDRPSAEALVFAARRLAADPVLVVVAMREATGTPFLGAGLPQLPLEGLAAEDARRLLELRWGGRGTASAAVATQVHHLSGGNPLAITEIARDPSMLRTVPPATPLPVPRVLADGFRRRALAAGATVPALLALVETAGDQTRLVLRAGRSLGLDVSGLAAAEAAGLVRLEGDRLLLTHPLVGSSAYAGLDASERRAMHAAVAAALPEAEDTRRAWHRAAAAIGPDDEVARELAGVGSRAMGRGAHAVAAAALERSAELTEADGIRALRLVEASHCAAAAGDGGWATRLADASLAQANGSPGVRGRALAAKAAVAGRSGSVRDAWAGLLAAAREVEAEDPDRAIRLAAEAVDVAYYLADGWAGRAAAEATEALLRRVDGPSAAIGWLALGMAQVMAGRDGSDALRAGVARLEAEADRSRREVDATWLIFGVLWLREEGATRRLVQAVEEARSRTAAGLLPHLLFHLARDGATTDRYAQAEADYHEGILLAEELGQETELAASLAGLAWLESRLGKEEACREHAARALEVGARHGVRMAEIWARHALGGLALSSGRLDEAREVLEGLVDLLRDNDFRDVDMSPDPELVEVLLRFGEVEAAAAVAERHEAAALVKGQPWSLARAGRSAGLLAPEGQLDEVFAQALEQHSRTPDVFETARTRLAYGARLRRARRRVDAREQLRAALADFERLGARTWASLAADELDATGEKAPRRGTSGLDLLTPRERQIVGLVASGRSVREAAAALFLSPKTVEYHLRNVYTKLGITSRGQLLELVGSSG